MLDLIRKKASSWFVKALMIVLAISFFIGFGILSGARGCDGETIKNYAAKVNGQAISISDYQQTFNIALERYRQMLGEQFDLKLLAQLDLPKQVLDSMVIEVLLVEEAEKLGISVPDDYLQKKISEAEYFKDSAGNFDFRRYRDLLSSNRLTPSTFEEKERERLLGEVLRNLIADSLVITPQEIKAEYYKKNEKVKLAVLSYSPADYIDKVRPSSDQISDYFNTNPTDFELPIRRKVEYVEFDAEEFKKGIKITDEQARAEYNLNTDDYFQPEQARARHILLTVSKDATADEDAEIKSLAETLIQRINDGEDFEKLAAEFGEDGTSAKGGDLGTFERGKMVKPFEDAVFSADLGLIQTPVKTMFGYHVIKVEEIKREAQQSFEDVKSVLVDKLAMRQARLAARDGADKVHADIKSGKKLSDIDLAKSLKWRQTNFFSRVDNIEGIESPRTFAAIAFELAPDQISDIATAGNSLYIIRLIEEKQKELPPLADVRNKVIEKIKSRDSIVLAEEAARSAIEKLESQVAPDKVAAQTGGVYTETDLLTLEAGSIEGVPGSEKLLQTAITNNRDSGPISEVFNSGGKKIVGYLLERQRADFTELELQEDVIVSRLKSEKSDKVVQQYLQSLQMTAEIDYNEQLLAEQKKVFESPDAGR